ncbi:MAG: sigma-70 family RNA polymerase sigma factor [Anaerolineae bacterium]|nr:sigma-70 family RNA polymerase sigma factor [Anaerolineae bacterium]
MNTDSSVDKTLSKTDQKESVILDQDAEQAAFEAAFEANWSWVCATLYRLVGDWDEAEDLALEVFYRLHDRPPQDHDRLNGWLHRVATNAGLNALRARHRRRRYEETAGVLRLQRADPDDPLAQVERDEAQSRVRWVLARMKPRAAQLLILRHSGLSYAEIAASLNIASGSVGTLLARAEKKFERLYHRLEERDETS